MQGISSILARDRETSTAACQQVHAAAVASDAYTPAGAVSDLKWFSTSGAWHFECQVDVKLLQYQWLEPGDLAVLSLEREGKYASLQGILVKIRGKWPSPVEGKSFIVDVELSEISELAWHAQEAFLDGASNWRLHFILIPPNEKKSIQLLQDMQRSCPLQGMRLTVPRSTKEMKREVEMRPLLTKEEARIHHRTESCQIFWNAMYAVWCSLAASHFNEQDVVVSLRCPA